jgi:hypothetical protein
VRGEGQSLTQSRVNMPIIIRRVSRELVNNMGGHNVGPALVPKP